MERDASGLLLDYGDHFQVSGIFKLLWPLATTNCGGLQAANSLDETSQVLWHPATTICGGLWPQT